MKIVVKGQIFPKIWDIASSVKKVRDGRKDFNLGAGTMSYSVYEVTLPGDTKREGNYLETPQGIRLYLSHGDQYGIDYLISELDNDPLVSKHFE
ncbi:MAG: hypothetical protein ACR2NW_01680 [Thermodesulfobacteriota bacterium]